MAGSKVSREIAEQEVTKWMDSKRMKSKKRESNAESVENLVDAISDGYLALDEETNVFTLKLSFPIDGVTDLKFKPRLTVAEAHKRLERVKPTDVDARIMAYICALTGQNSGVIGALDTDDYGICQSIAVFFF